MVAERLPRVEVDEGARDRAILLRGIEGLKGRFTIGPDGARMIWVLTPGGFENLIEAVSVPAETPSVGPPENVAEILRRHGNELLGA